MKFYCNECLELLTTKETVDHREYCLSLKALQQLRTELVQALETTVWCPDNHGKFEAKLAEFHDVNKRLQEYIIPLTDHATLNTFVTRCKEARVSCNKQVEDIHGLQKDLWARGKTGEDVEEEMDALLSIMSAVVRKLGNARRGIRKAKTIAKRFK